MILLRLEHKICACADNHRVVRRAADDGRRLKEYLTLLGHGVTMIKSPRSFEEPELRRPASGGGALCWGIGFFKVVMFSCRCEMSFPFFFLFGGREYLVSRIAREMFRAHCRVRVIRDLGEPLASLPGPVAEHVSRAMRPNHGLLKRLDFLFL